MSLDVAGWILWIDLDSDVDPVIEFIFAARAR
jgi:hypothetical protein